MTRDERYCSLGTTLKRKSQEPWEYWGEEKRKERERRRAESGGLQGGIEDLVRRGIFGGGMGDTKMKPGIVNTP